MSATKSLFASTTFVVLSCSQALTKASACRPWRRCSAGRGSLPTNTTSIPEVVGLEAAMFDPNSIDDIASKLQRVLTDDEFRRELVARHLVSGPGILLGCKRQLAIKAFEDLHAAAGTRPPAAMKSTKNLITSTATIIGKKALSRSRHAFPRQWRSRKTIQTAVLRKHCLSTSPSSASTMPIAACSA